MNQHTIHIETPVLRSVVDAVEQDIFELQPYEDYEPGNDLYARLVIFRDIVKGNLRYRDLCSFHYLAIDMRSEEMCHVLDSYLEEL